MTELFYLLGIVYIAYELYNAINPQRRLSTVEFLKDEDIVIKTYKIDTYTILGLSYSIWTIIGIIFSSQFLLFITLMVIGILTVIFKKVYPSRNQVLALITMDAIACIIVLSLIVYKHFS